MRREAKDSLRQAEEDLITAKLNIEIERYYASVFFSQQSAEKALKAECIEKLKILPQEHNLIELAKMLNAPENIMKSARELNPEYLITRYIDAANGIPSEMYDKESAELHLRCAEEILGWIKKLLNI
jgi:HEPN domain-containing protein